MVQKELQKELWVLIKVYYFVLAASAGRNFIRLAAVFVIKQKVRGFSWKREFYMVSL